MYALIPLTVFLVSVLGSRSLAHLLEGHKSVQWGLSRKGRGSSEPRIGSSLVVTQLAPKLQFQHLEKSRKCPVRVDKQETKHCTSKYQTHFSMWIWAPVYCLGTTHSYLGAASSSVLGVAPISVLGTAVPGSQLIKHVYNFRVSFQP